MKHFSLLLTLAALWFSTAPAAVSNETENDAATRKWVADAAARIEQHRKADVRIVVTRGGKPVPGAEVKVAMRRHEFLFGANIFKLDQNRTAAENAAYARQFREIFNFSTLAYYWSSYEHKKGDTSGSRARNEKIAAWCAANGIKTKGHTLAWNYYDPAWASSVSDEELYDRQIARIGDCISQFGSKIGMWDVVNEVTEWDREDCQKRAPRATRIMGKYGVAQYIKNCFVAARKAADALPAGERPLLIINDYERTEAYAKLLEQLTGPDGKPIYDAIGIQWHTHAEMWSDAKIREICDRLGRFGKPVHFTELTVLSTREKFSWTQHAPLGPTTPDGELWQRDHAVRIYTLLFSHPAVEAITWWDFSDQGAWMNGPGGLLRKDMTPKPAYDALKKLITKDWTTNATLKTNSSGVARLRAFRGDYDIQVSLPGKTSASPRTIKAKVVKAAGGKNSPNEIRVALD